MRRFCIFIFVFVLASSLLWTGTEEVKNSRISISGGAYFLRDDVFKQVYGNHAWIVCGGYSYRLPFLLKNHLEVGVNFRFLSDKGKLTVTKEPVDLVMSDVTLTVKYLFDLNPIIPYAGPGLQYIWYKEEYPPLFPVSSVRGSVAGLSFQAGCYYDFSSSLGIDVSVLYCLARAEEGMVQTDIGGIGIKAGMVYRFDF
ncbi:MAG: outer membrane beta-barrel protein [Candidatus Aminicenantes bacterium]|nr:outer membrane beta-barrel protein [Candidatus Aminicenantes bacterium]